MPVSPQKVGVVGATGAVGMEMVKVRSQPVVWGASRHPVDRIPRVLCIMAPAMSKRCAGISGRVIRILDCLYCMQVLFDRKFPVSELHLFASERSAGLLVAESVMNGHNRRA